ncbi:hypothetical protein [Pseudomonas viridiflava]|uniref:hypothetical protein n=1 Tax=Pseudomonas viridiflava TaxID=33069 RepID=UPI000F07E9FD|nr:hypothetical protein [Pseudomonas viridiflava]
MKKNTIRFAPWVGSQYAEGFCGLRILLVCESHYGDKKHERPTATPEIVKALALGEKHPKATGKLRRHPHFTKIMSAVKNARKSFSNPQKKEFWNSVAYYNFLQEFMRDTRAHPTKDAWGRGGSAFTEVLDVLAPDLIVCFSARNGGRIRSLAGSVPVAVVNHPSSRFAYSRVNPVIAAHKEMALVRKAQVPAFTRSDAFERWSEATVSALPTPGPHLSESDMIAILEERRASMVALDESLLT